MKIIANKYKLIKLIGSGGMGEVFLGEVLGSYGFKRRIAVKLLPRDMRKDKIFREAFINEARTLAGISHPNLVKVFDFGDAGDRLFLCMEYIRGFSLRELINITGKWGERIPIEIAVKIVAEILEGLHYIHGKGVIHGDLTPKNIMVGLNGEFKILDFGLSRVLRNMPSEIPIGGKAGYIAPEVIREKRTVPASDLYALGAIIREILGEIVAEESITSAPGFDVHVKLSDHSDACLSQDPEKRPDVGALLESVKQLKRHIDSGFEIKDYLSQLPFEDEYTFVFPDRSPPLKTKQRRDRFPKWVILFVASVTILFLLWSRQTQVKRSQESVKKDGNGVLEIERTNEPMREFDSNDKERGERKSSANNTKYIGAADATKEVEGETPVPMHNKIKQVDEDLEVRSYPDKATVFLNGKDMGRTPVFIPMKHFDGKEDTALQLKLEGFKKTIVEIPRDVAGRRENVFVLLKEATGFLSVNVNPWAYVFIDGEKVGTTPIIHMALPVGEHTLDLKNDKLGASISRNVVIKEGNTETLIEDFYR
jgi:serine/threonine protein kinase